MYGRKFSKIIASYRSFTDFNHGNLKNILYCKCPAGYMMLNCRSVTSPPPCSETFPSLAQDYGISWVWSILSIKNFRGTVLITNHYASFVVRMMKVAYDLIHMWCHCAHVTVTYEKITVHIISAYQYLVNAESNNTSH